MRVRILAPRPEVGNRGRRLDKRTLTDREGAPWLTLTENARDIVRSLIAQSSDAEAAGLRISAEDTAVGAFQVSVVTSPGEDETVVEEDGARVFLEPTAAFVLGDMMLDAQLGQEGALQFALVAQP